MKLEVIFVLIFCGQSYGDSTTNHSLSPSSSISTSFNNASSSTSNHATTISHSWRSSSVSKESSSSIISTMRPSSSNNASNSTSKQSSSSRIPTIQPTSEPSGTLNNSNAITLSSSSNVYISSSSTTQPLSISPSSVSISSIPKVSPTMSHNNASGTTSPTISTSTVFTTQPTSSSKLPLVLEVTLKLNAGKFDKDLYNKQSLRFLKLKNEVENQIKTAYNKTQNFLSVTVIEFREGSIICESRLYFANSSIKDVPSLNNTLVEYGEKSGEFEVSKFGKATDDVVVDDEDDDDILLGLDWWQIGLVIAGVVIFILLITVIVLCRKISTKKRKQGNMLPYSSPFYETIGAEEEMKTLRASDVGNTSGLKNGNEESGKQRVNMYSSTSSSNGKSDGLVNETTSKVGKDNAGADVNESDYVTILDTNSSAGDVVKL